MSKTTEKAPESETLTEESQELRIKPAFYKERTQLVIENGLRHNVHRDYYRERQDWAQYVLEQLQNDWEEESGLDFRADVDNLDAINEIVLAWRDHADTPKFEADLTAIWLKSPIHQMFSEVTGVQTDIGDQDVPDPEWVSELRQNGYRREDITKLLNALRALFFRKVTNTNLNKIWFWKTDGYLPMVALENEREVQFGIVYVLQRYHDEMFETPYEDLPRPIRVAKANAQFRLNKALEEEEKQNRSSNGRRGDYNNFRDQRMSGGYKNQSEDRQPENVSHERQSKRPW